MKNNVKFKLSALSCMLATASASRPVKYWCCGLGRCGRETLTSILFTPDPRAMGPCSGAPCNGDVNTGST